MWILYYYYGCVLGDRSVFYSSDVIIFCYFVFDGGVDVCKRCF